MQRNVHEGPISYHEYMQLAKNELQNISTWPNPVEDQRWEGDGICPFDLTPGHIKEFLDLEDYPFWVRTFKEKGIIPDGQHFAQIPIDINDYPKMEFVTNDKLEEKIKRDFKGSFSVRHFLNDEPGSSLHMERELLYLIPGCSPVLIERVVATLTEHYATEDEYTHDDIVSLCIIRPLIEEEQRNYYDLRTSLVWHITGVVPYDEEEIGIYQLWYLERCFLEQIDKDLLFAPRPIFYGFGKDGTYAIDTKATSRNPCVVREV